MSAKTVEEMSGTMVEYYGLKVESYGDEGSIVILGHAEERRAIAAINRYYREVFGVGTGFERYEEALSPLHVTYAHLRADKDPDISWWIEPCSSSDPAAFPVTLWDVN